MRVGIGTNHGPSRPTDTGTNHLAIAPHLVTNGGTTQGTHGSAEGGLILVSMIGCSRTAQGATNSSPGQSTSLTAQLLPQNGASNPASSPSNCRIQILSSKRRASQNISDNATCRTKGFDCLHGRLPVVISPKRG